MICDPNIGQITFSFKNLAHQWGNSRSIIQTSSYVFVINEMVNERVVFSLVKSRSGYLPDDARFRHILDHIRSVFPNAIGTRDGIILNSPKDVTVAIMFHLMGDHMLL